MHDIVYVSHLFIQNEALQRLESICGRPYMAYNHGRILHCRVCHTSEAYKRLFPLLLADRVITYDEQMALIGDSMEGEHIDES